MARIHQLTAGFANGDAISDNARYIRGRLRAWGHASEVYCESRRILPELRRDVRSAEQLAAEVSSDDVVILHLSIGSVVNDIFKQVPCRKAILYHNITPAHFFDHIQAETARHLAWGREQMAALSGTAEVNLAASRFNAAELLSAGYRDPQVLPLLIDFDRLGESPDAGVTRRLADGICTVLSVGRVAPNKRIEDVLHAFALFQKIVPRSRFVHVGSFAGTERYYFLLQAMARELDIQNFGFCGSVPQSHLNAYYRASDAVLAMSAHEGFCVPLLEAMAHERPVLATADGAIPETLDGAGILFQERDHAAIAETLARLQSDAALRAAVIAAQNERLARYRRRDLESELRNCLAPLLSP